MAQPEANTHISKLPDLIPPSEITVENLEEVDGASNDNGYIYCIVECENGQPTGYYKIGTASNPNKRISDLQTGNVRQLCYWGEPKFVHHRLDVESAVHSALSRYTANLGGGTEWFKASTESEQRNLFNTFNWITENSRI